MGLYSAYSYYSCLLVHIYRGIQVGSESTSENQIVISIELLSASHIGVLAYGAESWDSADTISVSDHAAAKGSIDKIKDALVSISKQRSDLGAIQNRLEHTIKNLDNVAENTQAAESQIRDTDMAEEMVRYSNNNILAQAGQSMLAQANQTNQGVLSLLQ